MNFIYPIGLPIALSLAGYNSILTGLFVFFKRRDRTGFHYLIFSFFVFAWGIGISFMLNNDLLAEAAHRWGVFSQIAALFIPVTWLHFILVYTDQFNRLRLSLWLAYAATLIMLPFSGSKLFVAGFRSIVQVKYYPIPGPFYVAFTILFFLLVSFTFLILFKAWRKEKSLNKKADYRLLFFAQLYGFTTGSLSFFPVYGVQLPQYNLLIMPLWQFLLAYAMVRHNLFDIEAFVQAAQRDKLAAIGTLATSINHEIRNPLYIIKGLAESHLANLEDNIYSSEKEALLRSNEIMKETAEQSRRAMEIMKRFAAFAKQDMRRETEAVNLREAFEGVLPLVQHELELDKIQLIREIPNNLPEIHADRHQVEEIFFNLVVNACQAMKDGGKLTVRAEQKNGSVQFEISDTGPGVPAEQRSKVFEPFYTTKDSGTGLGLYVTKQLVERNGGHIFLQSKLNQGANFILKFPANK